MAQPHEGPAPMRLHVTETTVRVAAHVHHQIIEVQEIIVLMVLLLQLEVIVPTEAELPEITEAATQHGVHPVIAPKVVALEAINLREDQYLEQVIIVVLRVPEEAPVLTEAVLRVEVPVVLVRIEVQAVQEVPVAIEAVAPEVTEVPAHGLQVHLDHAEVEVTVDNRPIYF